MLMRRHDAAGFELRDHLIHGRAVGNGAAPDTGRELYPGVLFHFAHPAFLTDPRTPFNDWLFVEGRFWVNFDLGHFDPQIVEDHGRQNHSGNAHQFFADDQADEGEPDRIPDAGPDYFAVQEILQLMDNNEEDERHDRHLARDEDPEENDDGVAEDVANDREQPAEECEPDDNRRVGNSNRENEDCRQEGVDRGDNHLGADYRGKAPVEVTEARGNFVGEDRVKIIPNLVGFTEQIEPPIEENAHRANDRDDDKNKSRRSVAGKISEIANITSLIFDRRHGMRLKAFEIGEGKGQIVGFSPGDRGRNRVISDLRQSFDGLPRKMPGGISNRRNDDDKDCEGKPLTPDVTAEFAQDEVGKKEVEKWAAELEETYNH